MILAATVIAISALCAGAQAEAEQNLVLHYTFDEGAGTVVHDQSGNNNNAAVHGAQWVKSGAGYALKFDGESHVESVSGGDMDRQITMEAWALIKDGQPHALPEIVGRGRIAYQSAALMYRAGTQQCLMFVSGGRRKAGEHLVIDAWQHIVGTFDGQNIKIYVNGELVGQVASDRTKVAHASKLYAGRGLAGVLDELKVYNRALSPEEIAAHYRSTRTDKLTPFWPISGEAQTLTGDGFSLRVGGRGGAELHVGQDAYYLASAFSYPGETIGWNAFCEKPGGKNTWKVETAFPRPNSILIKARGQHYSVTRKISIEKHRLKLEDTLTNIGVSDVGIMVRNQVVTPQPFETCLLGGAPENVVSDLRAGINPTLFIAQEHSRMGVVAEDDIFRAQWQTSSSMNQATASTRRLALTPGKSQTLEWAVYPLDKEADYFTLINRIRKDWGTNFTIDGSFDFGRFCSSAGDIYPERFATPQMVKHQLQLGRKPVKFLQIMSYLEHPSYNRLTRSDFKKHAQEIMRVVKAVDPHIQCLGGIEASLVSANTQKVAHEGELGEFIRDFKGTRYPVLPDDMTKLVEAADLPWKDSFVRTPEMGIRMMVAKRPGLTGTAFVVYPEIGNYQYAYLMGQVKFLIDEVGMDGVYFDTFGYGNDYSKWDGVSVEIDPYTGKITKRYTDTFLAAAPVRVEICKYLLSRGKTVVCNDHARFRTTQSLPVFRFMETQHLPRTVAAGDKPPLSFKIATGQLGSPLALLDFDARRNAQDACKALVSYLRHGLVCYFYATHLPESGAGSGDYGPFRHMFPLTPIALHEGWIEAKERIMTCVSGEYLCEATEKPVAHLFDAVGREKPHQFMVEKAGNRWRVHVTLADWEEVAVIETKEAL